VDPVVNISVVEYRSRMVSVVGAVNHPTTFQAIGRTTLIDALARAEGLSPTAGSSIVISSLQEDGQREWSGVMRINVADLLGGATPEANLRLHGGEEIRVAEARKIFVAGNVRHPGMYSMQSDSDTTVVKALALSSGLDSYSKNVAFIYRKKATGSQREEIRVPLKEILNHHSPDLALVADDILYVPTSDGKRLTGKILNQIAGFGQTAEAGLLLTR
jgi:polysaccharide export outer membrane protein